jgi:hypothetical protein
MKATVVYGAGDVRVEEVPDPTIQQPTDAIVRVVAGCVCGSDRVFDRTVGLDEVPDGYQAMNARESPPDPLEEP